MQNKNRQPQFVTMSHNYSKMVLNLLATKQPIIGGILFNESLQEMLSMVKTFDLN